jgi:hypothetical protein
MQRGAGVVARAKLARLPDAKAQHGAPRVGRVVEQEVHLFERANACGEAGLDLLLRRIVQLEEVGAAGGVPARPLEG